MSEPQDNTLKIIERLIEEGKIPRTPGGHTAVHVNHDFDCPRALKTGLCNCDPDIWVNDICIYSSTLS